MTLCGYTLDIKSSDNIIKICKLHDRHEGEHSFENDENTEQRNIDLYKMLRTIEPDSPIYEDRIKNIFSKWNGNTQYAFIFRMLSLSQEQLPLSMKQRFDFLNTIDSRNIENIVEEWNFIRKFGDKLIMAAIQERHQIQNMEMKI